MWRCLLKNLLSLKVVTKGQRVEGHMSREWKWDITAQDHLHKEKDSSDQSSHGRTGCHAQTKPTAAAFLLISPNTFHSNPTDLKYEPTNC